MSSEWLETSVGDVATVVTKGTTPTTLGYAFQENGVRFVKVETLTEDGRFLDDKFAFISAEAHQALSRSQLKENDVLFTIAGTIGRTSIVSKKYLPANTNQAVAIIRPKTNLVEPVFLRYLLANPAFTRSAQSKTVQSVQANFSLGELKKARIHLPPIDIQKFIISVLGPLDDRITLLRETNATLEAIAQALFKSWFVDFDPVRAKAEGCQPEGMDAATAALFPDSFEDSELGLVPRGWAVRSLDSVAEFLNGLALQKFPPTEESWLPVIKIAQMRKGDISGADRANGSIKQEYIIQNGDVLFSWSGSLEVAIWCGGAGALNQHLFKVTSSEFPKWFFYLWTKEHLAHFQQIAASKATTMGHIQRKHLTEAKVVVPAADTLRHASEVIAPLLERWIANAEQAQTLTQLRDTLLPRLISGQLRLPEAEAVLEEVL